MPNRRIDQGFSLMEMMIALMVLSVAMAAAIGLFSFGANQHTTEQSSIDANQDARSAFEIMTTELSQAGSHGDVVTTSNGSITGNTTNVQMVAVASTAGLNAGDWVDVGMGTLTSESVELTAVSSNTVSGIFRYNHAPSTKIHLFALPFMMGVLPASGMAIESTATVNPLRFFGDIDGNSTVEYVEYKYQDVDTETGMITRSVTNAVSTTKGDAVPFVLNVKKGSVTFTVNTDNLGAVTSVQVKMTVRNALKTGTQHEETELSSRIAIPSVITASALKKELLIYGGIDKLPNTPTNVATLVEQQ